MFWPVSGAECYRVVIAAASEEFADPKTVAKSYNANLVQYTHQRSLMSQYIQRVTCKACSLRKIAEMAWSRTSSVLLEVQSLYCWTLNRFQKLISSGTKT